ncbi:hypothetical protein Celaphus_00006391 [Cervus elaphus hippelaphus]|uniref:G-protein coupled receptors family 1 profile domain-containing protein n=1 Tax=Cervus elaphus hippelaphus TaxID=46360 RepID=A0A212CU91_CEREH|nr:hypothetical protein Celaphus_00006391 [Cervus elaphus hippelaphus]
MRATLRDKHKANELLRQLLGGPGSAVSELGSGQTLSSHSSGSEMMLLVAMAIDRYVAICKPLHYMTIMSPRVLTGLLLSSYAVGFVHSASQMAFMLNLPFCGPNVVDSFFCDLPLVIKLACEDTYVLQLLVIADSGLLSLVCFLLLLVSYTIDGLFQSKCRLLSLHGAEADTCGCFSNEIQELWLSDNNNSNLPNKNLEGLGG